MHDARLNFVLQEFIAPEYIEAERSDYLLTENQDSGYTELTLHVKGENICIAQYDKKNRCGFWNRGQRNGFQGIRFRGLTWGGESGILLSVNDA